MNIETARASVGKFVLVWSHAPKLIAFRKGDRPYGPIILEQITKGGMAMLKGSETQIPPSLLTLHEETPMGKDREPTSGRIDPKQFSREELFQSLCDAKTVIADQLQQIVVHCISAHWRNGDITTALAAKVCGMTEDDFRRIQTKVDEEARRFIMENEEHEKKSKE